MIVPAIDVRVVEVRQAQVREVKGMEAKGNFTVMTEPQQDAIAAGRFVLDKVFHGGLEGTSKGQMLSAMGTVKGSGAYVAVETFTGTLAGKTGTFALYHSGVMQGGTAKATITVVPDSGTGELMGLVGTMTIDPAKGHAYVFTYTLPE